ncbi:hypothetical protein L9F63_019620, partial [Diploptera punctata]
YVKNTRELVMLLEELKAAMESEQSEPDENLCRICATTGYGNLFSIYSKQGELWNVVEKIGRCLPIIVLPTDELPLNICNKCLNKLNTSYELVITSLNSEAKLRAKFNLDAEPEEILHIEELDYIEVKEETPCDTERLTSSPSLQDRRPLDVSCECDAALRMSQKMDVGENCTSDHILKFINFECGGRISKHVFTINHKWQHGYQLSTCQSNNIIQRTGSGNVKVKIMEIKLNLMMVMIEETKAPTLNIYGPATCDLCNMTFIDMNEFDKHVANEHLQEYKFQCNRCDEGFKESSDIIAHKTTEHNEQPISCTKCQNENDEHNAPEEGLEEEWLEEAEYLYEEKLRNGIAKNEDMLKNHSMPVSRQPICNKCGLKFNTWHDLSIHKKVHVHNVKDRRFVCDGCKKVFLDRILFNIHRRSCMNKQYVCNICNRVFWRKYSLQLHMKVNNK